MGNKVLFDRNIVSAEEMLQLIDGYRGLMSAQGRRVKVPVKTQDLGNGSAYCEVFGVRRYGATVLLAEQEIEKVMACFVEVANKRMRDDGLNCAIQRVEVVN